MYIYIFMKAYNNNKSEFKKDIYYPIKSFFFKKDKLNKIYFLYYQKLLKFKNKGKGKFKGKGKNKFKGKAKHNTPIFKKNRFSELIKKRRELRKKYKNKFGVLRISTEKRNIFINLSDRKGKIRYSFSSGLLKVKGRKRQAPYIIKKSAYIIIRKIIILKLYNLDLIIKGRTYNKKTNTLYRTFFREKKLKFLVFNRPAPRSHNGCRPRKIRRK